MPKPERQNDEILGDMLARWEACDEGARDSVESEIRDVFGETHAVFVLDMSRFSSSVMRHGILHFLARIHAMRRVAVPLIHEHEGAVVKFIGDDVIALFPDVPQALAASTRIVQATAKPDTQFKVAIGIGYGEILHVPKLDIWGHEVNLAFKLGEDTAAADEILLTEAAFARLDDDARKGFENLHISVSGLELKAHALHCLAE